MQNNNCKHCTKPFNSKEVARIYGEESPVVIGGFCSAKCYTDKTTQPQERSLQPVSNQEENKQHTPLKAIHWGQTISISNDENTAIVNANGNHNAGIPSKEDREFAARIVSSWNEHDELKALNRELIDTLTEITEMAKQWSVKGLTPTIFKAETLLAKASKL